MREKDAADYDLERFTEMFDQALTSNDPRVKNALRQLMMMVVLTDTNDHEGKQRQGPLRRMQEDMRDIARRMNRLDDELNQLKQYTTVQRSLGGYRSEGWPRDFDSGFDIKYNNTATNAIGQSVDPKEYWAAMQRGVKIADDQLRDLNIKINSGLLPKDEK